MSDGMVPRITVTDDDDRCMVIVALMHHMRWVTTSALQTGNVSGMVDDTKALARLLEDLITEAVVPTDNEMSEYIERLARELRRDDGSV